MRTLKIKPRCGQRAKSGHPWIFSNEVEHQKPFPVPGEIVQVEDENGQFVGYATYNPHSLIALRLLSREKDDFPASEEWFKKRIENAYRLRHWVYPKRRSYRLIYADSDDLPGVVVDRYEDILVVQIQTAGMERLLDPFCRALKNVLKPTGIMLRNDSDIRALEGLESYKRLYWGEVPEVVEIEEYGVKLAVDVRQGQKTGHFFDQTENRLALSTFARDSDVLDLFSYTGAWSLQMLLSGARHAWAVDRSTIAIHWAKHNRALNGFDMRLKCIEEEAFSWLSNARKENMKFDIVIVDPPAFAKSAKQTKKAQRGYEDVNRQAIRLVKERGILCSCSCSYCINDEAFLQLLQRAAAREKRLIKVLQIRGQAKDHPVLSSMPESRYLKCIIGMVESIS